MPSPPPELRSAIAASAGPAAVLAETAGYYSSGLPALRQWVAAWYTRRGLPTLDSQILITAGAQQALTLACQIVLRPQRPVVIESPTYLGALDQLRARRAQILTVPTSANGPDLERLTRLVRDFSPSMVFTMSTCHTITGAGISDTHREQIAALAASTSTIMVDDDILANLTFRTDPLPPLAAYRPQAPIVTIGGTSKLLWNGLRVGWLRAPLEYADRFSHVKGIADLGTSIVAQLVALELLNHADDLVAARTTEAVKRLDLAERLMCSGLSDWRWETPTGGWSLWLRLPPEASAMEFASSALQHGVSIASGTTFTADGSHDDHVRLIFMQPERRLRSGIQRLAVAWANYTGGVRQLRFRPRPDL